MGQPAQAATSRLIKPFWLVFCVVFVLAAATSNFEPLRYRYFEPERIGDFGAQRSFDSMDVRNVIVHDVAPGSPLAKIGAKNGDRLRMDRAGDRLRLPFAGETLGFTLLSSGRAVHRSLVVPATSAPTPDTLSGFFWSIYADVARTLLFAIGLFIVWRGRRTGSSVKLGMAFVCSSLCPPWLWPISVAVYPGWFLIAVAEFTATPLLLLRFAMQYNVENARPIRTRESALFWSLAASYILVASVSVAFAVGLFNQPGFFSTLAAQLRSIAQSLNVITTFCAFYYLFRGWKASNAETRARYAVMVIALPVSFIGSVIYQLIDVFHLSNLPPTVMFVADIGRYVGPMLFAYAIFRHKVLDLGFVINRALVYGVVSAILLVGFGIIEWAFEHFMPIKTLETNVLLNGGMALCIFLVFHRVRDFVEHTIEAWFFRDWHKNEAALNRFVSEAGFVTKPEGLTSALVAELRRFSGGALVALYMHAEDGNYRLVEGTSPEGVGDIDADDPALVALRARRNSIQPDDVGSRLSAKLALPMINRNNLAGFILLGSKLSGESYRPDEIEVLGRAVHHIGLDLYTLKVEQLEREKERLERDNEKLETRYRELERASQVSARAS